MANKHDKSLSLSARWIVFAGINLVFKSLEGLARCRALLVRVVVSSLHGDLLGPQLKLAIAVPAERNLVCHPCRKLMTRRSAVLKSRRVPDHRRCSCKLRTPVTCVSSNYVKCDAGAEYRNVIALFSQASSHYRPISASHLGFRLGLTRESAEESSRKLSYTRLGSSSLCYTSHQGVDGRDSGAKRSYMLAE